MNTYECFACEVSKPVSEFYKNVRAKRGHMNKCKSCYLADYRKKYDEDPDYRGDRIQHHKDKMDERRKFVWQYLENHPCVDCGNTDPRVLEFDHVRGKKVMGVTRAVGYSMTALTSEIEKCDVRCANCHRIKTYAQLGWRTYEPEKEKENGNSIEDLRGGSKGS